MTCSPRMCGPVGLGTRWCPREAPSQLTAYVKFFVCSPGRTALFSAVLPFSSYTQRSRLPVLWTLVAAPKSGSVRSTYGPPLASCFTAKLDFTGSLCHKLAAWMEVCGAYPRSVCIACVLRTLASFRSLVDLALTT